MNQLDPWISPYSTFIAMCAHEMGKGRERERERCLFRFVVNKNKSKDKNNFFLLGRMDGWLRVCV